MIDMKIKKIHGISFDAILLAVIRLLTTFLGIFSTMLLSKSLSLSAYGTYSQANLVISIGTSFSILGLTDGTNFFFNKAQDEVECRENLNTIFAIQIAVGGLLGFAILIFREWITQYFQNVKLTGIFIYIAFRPLLNNLLAMLQNLQVSIGRAKMIAVRNIAVSVVKLLAIYLAIRIFNDIKTIFLCLLFLDVITVVYFWSSFGRERYPIEILKANKKRVSGILKFCVPMGIFVLTNSLLRDIDKACIGRLGGTEELAIYTNCSTILPVDIISAAFLTVVIPIMTRYISLGEYKKGSDLFSYYIQIGYLTTATFSTAIAVLSKEVILLLYGEAYLKGQYVFLLYMIVSILRFANLSLVLSANGETQRLMMISIIGLIFNTFMNIALYHLVGFTGPAIATVIMTVATTFILLKRSINILHTNLNYIFDFKKLVLYMAELLVIVPVFRILANYMEFIGVPTIGIIILAGGGICGTIFIINIKSIVDLMKKINQLR